MKNYVISIALLAICTDAYPQSSNVTLAGKWLHSWRFETVFVNGNYAYCGTDSTMYILDISNPNANPSSVKALGQIRMADGISWIYVVNSKAYIAQGDSGMCIVDVSNPYIPVKMGSWSIPAILSSVKVSGNYAYVAADTLGMRVIDVSNPNSPVEVGFFNLGSGHARVVDISGNYAYIAYGLSGFRIVDISNPLAPVASGFISTLSSDNVFVRGNYAYVINGNLNIVDISNVSSPVLMGNAFAIGYMAGLFVSGNYAITFDGLDAYVIWDVSNPSLPIDVGQYAVGAGNVSNQQSIYISGSTAFLTRQAASNTTLASIDIVNISSPASPVFIGSYSEPQIAIGLRTKGHYLYTGGWTPPSGELITIFDINDPAHPTQVGMYRDSTFTTGLGMIVRMAISGNYLYLPTTETGPGNSYGFKIIDISNPLNPLKVGAFNINNATSSDMAVKGNYAYVCYGTLGLVVVDVINPASPVQVTSLTLSGGFPPLNIFISGSFAYVIDNAAKLHVINITNPASPVDVGTYQLSATGNDVYAEGNYAYVAVGAIGFQIIDVSAPSSPVLAGSYPAVSTQSAIYKQGNYVYLADVLNGMQVVDVSNPANPVQAGYYYDFDDYAWNVYADSLHSYLATDYGVYIFNGGITSSGSILEPQSQISVYPNLAKDFLQISNHSFQKNETLSIYNSTGEKVKSFTASKTFFIGDLPKGLYLVQLKNENEIISTEKIVLE